MKATRTKKDELDGRFAKIQYTSGKCFSCSNYLGLYPEKILDLPEFGETLKFLNNLIED